MAPSSRRDYSLDDWLRRFETLPEGFQRAEFLLEKGAIDMILDRRQSRDQIAGLLAKLSNRATLS